MSLGAPVANAFERASELHRAGHLLEAETLYREVLRVRKHPVVLHRLGVCLHQGGRWNEAARVLAQAVKANPSVALVHLSLAESLRALHQYDDALVSYERASRIAPSDPMPHVARGVALEEMRRYEDALVSYRQALALEAGNVPAMLGESTCLQMLGRLQDAVDGFDRVLAVNADNSLAACNRAVALTQLGRHREALGVLDELQSKRPNDPMVQTNRGNALFFLDRIDEALACQDAALALFPNLENAQLSRAATLVLLNRLEEAIEMHDRIIAVNPAHADSHRDRGMAHLCLGRFEDGWADFEWRDGGSLRPRDWTRGESSRSLANATRQWAGPLRDGEALRGKSILIYNEQGHGDSLQCLRYAGTLARHGATVIACVQAALASIARRIPGISQVVADGVSLPSTDLACSLMSLPYALGTSEARIPQDLPYVSADQDRVERWRGRVARSGNRVRVGIAWSGSRGHLGDRRRSVPLAKFASLGAAGVQFIALQPDLRESDEESISRFAELQFFGSEIADFEDTAALIADCDLIISVDTAIAHLAGAMARPVWTLLPFAPDWRWMLGRTDSPWYPSMRLFRQPRPGDWESVFSDVRDALGARMNCAEWPNSGEQAGKQSVKQTAGGKLR